MDQVGYVCCWLSLTLLFDISFVEFQIISGVNLHIYVDYFFAVVFMLGAFWITHKLWRRNKDV